MSRFVVRSFTLAALIGVTCSLGLAACKNKNKDTCNPDDYVFEKVAIGIQSAEALNLDEEGASVPMQVRLYLLSGDLATRSLDFDEVWEDAKTALGDEYISDKEFSLYPESNELIELPVDAKATHILAVGIFRQPVGNTWFQVYEIPQTYGQQACDLKKQEKDPATLGQPCLYLMFERNQIDGGKNVPPGFDEDKLETTCTPLYTAKKPAAEKEDEKAKKKDE
jgi:type VI secretion system protein VasD